MSAPLEPRTVSARFQVMVASYLGWSDERLRAEVIRQQATLERVTREQRALGPAAAIGSGTALVWAGQEASDRMRAATEALSRHARGSRTTGPLPSPGTSVGISRRVEELTATYLGWPDDRLREEIARQQEAIDRALREQRALPAGSAMGSGTAFVMARQAAAERLGAARAALASHARGEGVPSSLGPYARPLMLGGLGVVVGLVAGKKGEKLSRALVGGLAGATAGVVMQFLRRS